MTGELIIAIVAIVVLLVISAFFSGSETALTAASMPRLHQHAKRGSRRAKIVLDLYARKDRLIGAILLGNNIVNITASALATYVLLLLFGDAGVAYATMAMTLLIVIFAEVLPKTYAIGNADKASLVVAPLIRAVVIVLAPITHMIQIIVRTTVKPFGIELSKEFGIGHREEELRGAIDLHEAALCDNTHLEIIQGSGSQERHIVYTRQVLNGDFPYSGCRDAIKLDGPGRFCGTAV